MIVGEKKEPGRKAGSCNLMGSLAGVTGATAAFVCIQARCRWPRRLLLGGSSLLWSRKRYVSCGWS
jgi:hypothetical protein